MNTEWITDRLPTGREIRYGKVWVTDNFGYVAMVEYETIQLGAPWQPIPKPEPYVKPKRWTVKWGGEDGNSDFFTLYDSGEFRYYLPELTSDQSDAAQRICDIYNEVMP
jgi:hypothetical protein